MHEWSLVMEKIYDNHIITTDSKNNSNKAANEKEV